MACVFRGFQSVANTVKIIIRERTINLGMKDILEKFRLRGHFYTTV